MANQGIGGAPSTIDPNALFTQDFNDPDFDMDLGNYPSDGSIGDLMNQDWQGQFNGYVSDSNDSFNTGDRMLADPMQLYMQPQEGYTAIQPTSAPNLAPGPRTAGARFHFEVGWYLPYFEGMDNSRLENHPSIGWFVRTVGPPPPGSSSYTSSVSSREQNPNMAYPPPMPASNNPYPAVGYGQALEVPLNQHLTAPSHPPAVQAPNDLPVRSSSQTAKESAKKTKAKGGRDAPASRIVGKYGPSAYLREQNVRRVKGDLTGPRPVSRESYNWGPHAGRVEKKKRKSRQEVEAVRSLPGFILKMAKMATVQRCMCERSVQVRRSHVARPRNAFLIFRSEFGHQFRPNKGEKKGQHSGRISTDSAAKWNTLTPEEKAPYHLRAKQDSERVKAQNPDYKYNPGKMVLANYGYSDCTCGARNTNEALLRAHGSPTKIGAALVALQDDEAEQPQFSGGRAPVAQMYSRRQHLDDDEDEDENEDEDDHASGDEEEDYEAPSASPARQRNNGGRRRSQHAIDFDGRPTATRRSIRTATKNVQYIEEDEDEDSLFVQQDENDDGETTPTRANPNPSRGHRPAYIATADANDSIAELNEFFDLEDRRAGRRQSVTRSPRRHSSRSKSAELPSAFMPDEYVMGDETLDDLFGEAKDVDGDDIPFNQQRRTSNTPKPVGKLALPQKSVHSTERMTRSQASKPMSSSVSRRGRK